MRLCVACLLGVLLLLLAPLVPQAQVLVPPTSSSGGAPPLPPSECLNMVVTGVDATGLLVCAPVTPAMTSGLVPAGVDVSASGQVTATHLALPLPPTQGGTGLASGTPGGLLYYVGPTTLASSPALPVHQPLFGGGGSQPPVAGLRSGTTLTVITLSGPPTVGKQTTFDASGNLVASAADVSTAGVTSVFSRTGVVVAQMGDYSAAQVTGAADLAAANVFAHPSGQIMARLVLPGSISGSLTQRGPPIAGTSLLTWPAGSTDFSITGGPGQVLQQPTLGGPFTVGLVPFSALQGSALPTQLPPLQALAGILTPAQGGTGWSDTTVSGSTHVLATVSGTLVPGQCLTADAQRNVISTGSACGSGAGGGVSSIFGRTGAVVAQAGDYTAGQVSGAADLAIANIFTNPAGQTMRRLLLLGSTSGTLALQAPAVAGSASLTLPGGTTDFSTLGGAGHVLRQQTLGGPLSTGLLSASDLSNGTTGTGPVVLQNAPSIPRLANLTQDGFVRSTGGNGTLAVDATTYLTANQPINITGDATGLGATTITLTVSRINGAVFSGLPGRVVAFGAGGTTPVDGGALAALLVTAPAPFTAGMLLQGGGANRTANVTGIATTTVCTSTSICLGYEAVANKSAAVILGTSDELYPTQNAVKTYVDDAINRLNQLAVGSVGHLQASDGHGGFAAYGGDVCDTVGTFMIGTTATGVAVCAQPPVLALSARPLLAEASPEVPQGVNLGALASGLVTTTVIAGIATVATLPVPAGGLVGLTAAQTVSGKRAIPRPLTLPMNQATLTLNPDLFDVATASNFLQPVLFGSPGGSGAEGERRTFQVGSAVTQPVTWGAGWCTGLGLPLPTHTTGGLINDLWDFAYNPNAGCWMHAYNSQWWVALGALITGPPLTLQGSTRRLMTVAGILTPGHCLTTDEDGSLVDAGAPCGTGSGGAGTAAGQTYDAQFRGTDGQLAADTGRFVFDPRLHTLHVQRAMAGAGTGAVELRHASGFTGLLMTQPLTAPRAYFLPDQSGELCTVETCAASVLRAARGGPQTSPLTSSRSMACPRTAPLCTMHQTDPPGGVHIAAPAGVPDDGEQLRLGLLCAELQTLTWDPVFRPGSRQALPATCPGGAATWLYVTFLHSTVTTAWQLIGVE